MLIAHTPYTNNTTDRHLHRHPSPFGSQLPSPPFTRGSFDIQRRLRQLTLSPGMDSQHTAFDTPTTGSQPSSPHDNDPARHHHRHHPSSSSSSSSSSIALNLAAEVNGRGGTGASDADLNNHLIRQDPHRAQSQSLSFSTPCPIPAHPTETSNSLLPDHFIPLSPSSIDFLFNTNPTDTNPLVHHSPSTSSSSGNFPSSASSIPTSATSTSTTFDLSQMLFNDSTGSTTSGSASISQEPLGYASYAAEWSPSHAASATLSESAAGTAEFFGHSASVPPPGTGGARQHTPHGQHQQRSSSPSSLSTVRPRPQNLHLNTQSPSLIPQVPSSVSAVPTPEDDDRSSTSSPTQQPQQTRRHGRKLPKPVTDLLRKWLLDHADHPYPNDQEKKMLCERTQLTLTQLGNWMINGRRRILVSVGRNGSAPSGPSISSAPYHLARRPTSSDMASAQAHRAALPQSQASSSTSGGSYQQSQQQTSRQNLYPHQGSSSGSRSYRGMTISHSSSSPVPGPFPPGLHRTYSSPAPHQSVSPVPIQSTSSPGMASAVVNGNGGYGGPSSGRGALPHGYASTFTEARNMAAYAMGGYQFPQAGSSTSISASEMEMANWTAATAYGSTGGMQRHPLQNQYHHQQQHQHPSAYERNEFHRQQVQAAALAAYNVQFRGDDGGRSGSGSLSYSPMSGAGPQGGGGGSYPASH